METLQNNFTTPEQSNRLLELGVPEDSADCYYHHYFTNDPTPLLRVLQPQWNETIGAIRGKSGQKIEPCWSIGRLIEIELKCRKEREGYTPRLRFSYFETPNKKDGRTMIENFVRYMTEGPYEYDFTKCASK